MDARNSRQPKHAETRSIGDDGGRTRDEKHAKREPRTVTKSMLALLDVFQHPRCQLHPVREYDGENKRGQEDQQRVKVVANVTHCTEAPQRRDARREDRDKDTNPSVKVQEQDDGDDAKRDRQDLVNLIERLVDVSEQHRSADDMDRCGFIFLRSAQPLQEAEHR